MRLNIKGLIWYKLIVILIINKLKYLINFFKMFEVYIKLKMLIFFKLDLYNSCLFIGLINNLVLGINGINIM